MHQKGNHNHRPQKLLQLPAKNSRNSAKTLRQPALPEENMKMRTLENQISVSYSHIQLMNEMLKLKKEASDRQVITNNFIFSPEHINAVRAISGQEQSVDTADALRKMIAAQPVDSQYSSLIPEEKKNSSGEEEQKINSQVIQSSSNQIAPTIRSRQASETSIRPSERRQCSHHENSQNEGNLTVQRKRTLKRPVSKENNTIEMESKRTSRGMQSLDEEPEEEQKQQNLEILQQQSSASLRNTSFRTREDSESQPKQDEQFFQRRQLSQQRKTKFIKLSGRNLVRKDEKQQEEEEEKKSTTRNHPEIQIVGLNSDEKQNKNLQRNFSKDLLTRLNRQEIASGSLTTRVHPNLEMPRSASYGVLGGSHTSRNERLQQSKLSQIQKQKFGMYNVKQNIAELMKTKKVKSRRVFSGSNRKKNSKQSSESPNKNSLSSGQTKNLTMNLMNEATERGRAQTGADTRDQESLSTEKRFREGSEVSQGLISYPNLYTNSGLDTIRQEPVPIEEKQSDKETSRSQSSFVSSSSFERSSTEEQKEEVKQVQNSLSSEEELEETQNSQKEFYGFEDSRTIENNQPEGNVSQVVTQFIQDQPQKPDLNFLNQVFDIDLEQESNQSFEDIQELPDSINEQEVFNAKIERIKDEETLVIAKKRNSSYKGKRVLKKESSSSVKIEFLKTSELQKTLVRSGSFRKQIWISNQLVFNCDQLILQEARQQIVEIESSPLKVKKRTVRSFSFAEMVKNRKRKATSSSFISSQLSQEEVQEDKLSTVSKQQTYHQLKNKVSLDEEAVNCLPIALPKLNKKMKTPSTPVAISKKSFFKTQAFQIKDPRVLKVVSHLKLQVISFFQFLELENQVNFKQQEDENIEKLKLINAKLYSIQQEITVKMKKSEKKIAYRNKIWEQTHLKPIIRHLGLEIVTQVNALEGKEHFQVEQFQLFSSILPPSIEENLVFSQNFSQAYKNDFADHKVLVHPLIKERQEKNNLRQIEQFCLPFKVDTTQAFVKIQLELYLLESKKNFKRSLKVLKIKLVNQDKEYLTKKMMRLTTGDTKDFALVQQVHLLRSQYRTIKSYLKEPGISFFDSLVFKFVWNKPQSLYQASDQSSNLQQKLLGLVKYCSQKQKIEVNIEVERKIINTFKTKKNIFNLQKNINRLTDIQRREKDEQKKVNMHPLLTSKMRKFLRQECEKCCFFDCSIPNTYLAWVYRPAFKVEKLNRDSANFTFFMSKEKAQSYEIHRKNWPALKQIKLNRKTNFFQMSRQQSQKVINEESLKERSQLLQKSNSISNLNMQTENIQKKGSSGNMKQRCSVVQEEASEDMTSEEISPGKDAKLSQDSSRRFFEKSVQLIVDLHDTQKSIEGDRSTFQALMIADDVQRTQTESLFGMPKIKPGAFCQNSDNMHHLSPQVSRSTDKNIAALQQKLKQQKDRFRENEDWEKQEEVDLDKMLLDVKPISSQPLKSQQNRNDSQDTQANKLRQSLSPRATNTDYIQKNSINSASNKQLIQIEMENQIEERSSNKVLSSNSQKHAKSSNQLFDLQNVAQNVYNLNDSDESLSPDALNKKLKEKKKNQARNNPLGNTSESDINSLYNKSEESFNIASTTNKVPIESSFARKAAERVSSHIPSSPRHFDRYNFQKKLSTEDIKIPKEVQTFRTAQSFVAKRKRANSKKSMANHAKLDLVDEERKKIRSQQDFKKILKAVQEKNHQIIKEIMKCSFPMDTTNKELQTVLHLAVYYKNYEATEILLQNGAEVDAQDKFGNTPLHVAKMNGFLKIADILIKFGADQTLKNGEQKVAWDY